MNIYLYSLYKSFYFKFNKFSTISNLSIIFSTYLCLLLIIITLNISDGFKKNITDKIIELDGFLHIYPYNPNNQNLDKLNNLFNDTSDSIVHLYPYMQAYSVLKYNSMSEGVNLISLYHKEKFNKYIVNEYSKSDGIYIGNKLADKFNIKGKTDLVGVFIDNNNSRYLHRLSVKGIYETQIPAYDEYVVFSDYKISKGLEIFNLEEINEYIAYTDINQSNTAITNNYYIENWKVRNNDFYNWLNSYDIPIKILLFFLITVLIINNISMFNLDLINRKKEIDFLHTLGMKSKSIFAMFFLKFLSLTLLGICFGMITSCCLIYIQIEYNIIAITPSIYFSDFLPVLNNFNNYLYPSLFIIIITLFYPLFFFKKFKFEL